MNGDIELRFTINETSLIGFGHNTVYATGTETDQTLNLQAQGSGSVGVAGGISVEPNRTTHLNVDGAFYRYANQVYITVADSLYIRDRGGAEHFHFQTNTGQLRVKNLQVDGGINQESWVTPALQSGWINYSTDYNPCGYFRDSMGIVHLRGMVKDGTIGEPIFTLPAGYQPPCRELHIVMTNPNAVGRVDITPDGKVWAFRGSSEWISLDGICFRSA